MSVQQAQFHCPQCRQFKLFTRHEMNHTPHILASVFLCGLWLPVWGVLAATYNPCFRCSVCGFGDHTRYLSDPNLRRLERDQKRAKSDADSPPNQNKVWMFGTIALAGVLLFGGLIYLSVQKPKSIENLNQNIAAIPVQPDMPNAKILQDSKDFLRDNKGKMTDSGYYAIYKQLKKIPITAPEYAEAQKILTQYKKQIADADRRLK